MDQAILEQLAETCKDIERTKAMSSRDKGRVKELFINQHIGLLVEHLENPEAMNAIVFGFSAYFQFLDTYAPHEYAKHLARLGIGKGDVLSHYAMGCLMMSKEVDARAFEHLKVAHEAGFPLAKTALVELPEVITARIAELNDKGNKNAGARDFKKAAEAWDEIGVLSSVLQELLDYLDQGGIADSPSADAGAPGQHQS